MTSQFYENQFEINRQRSEFRRHEERLKQLVNPNLDVLHDLEVKGFSFDETPRGVVNAILSHGNLREAEFQYLITLNAFEKLKATMRVVEAQIALQAQIEERKMEVLNETLEDDLHQISRRFVKTSTALSQAFNNEENVNVADSDEFDKTMRKTLIEMRESMVEKLDRIVFRQVSDDTMAMEKEELIELTGEERLHCVQLVLEANEAHLSKIDRKLYEAAYLIKARDNGIIPVTDKKSPAQKQAAQQTLQDHIQGTLDSTAKALLKCETRIEACRQYMEKVFDMGNGNHNINEFTPIRYTGAPLRLLFEYQP